MLNCVGTAFRVGNYDGLSQCVIWNLVGFTLEVVLKFTYYIPKVYDTKSSVNVQISQQEVVIMCIFNMEIFFLLQGLSVMQVNNISIVLQNYLNYDFNDTICNDRKI